MSKIERYQGNVQAFASSAQGVERTVFGETTQANDLTSQITAAFLRGWGIVGPSEHPSLEDFNGAMYALSQFIAYQHQAGIPEWHEEQEYYAGSVCTHTGVAYQSIEDANIGNEPPSAHWTPVITSRNGSEYFQSLNATLTALATLAGTKDKMPYFNGTDTATLTALTAFARQILAQNDAAGVLSTIGLTTLGIGGTGTALAALDWQTFDFVPGARYFVSGANMTNIPAGMIISPSLTQVLEVTAYEGTSRHVTVQPSTTTPNYQLYMVRVSGNSGAKTITIRQILTSSNTIPISAGGTGATTDAGARANLSVPKGVDKQMCNEWCVFNGVTTITMGDSLGISSVTRTSVGQYTVNLSTPYPTTNYAVMGRWTSSTIDRDHELSVQNKTTSSFQLYCASDSSNLYPATDAVELSLSIWGAK